MRQQMYLASLRSIIHAEFFHLYTITGSRGMAGAVRPTAKPRETLVTHTRGNARQCDRSRFITVKPSRLDDQQYHIRVLNLSN
jgi:hypothetical protein